MAIVLAILMFFRRNWWPHGAVLGQVPGLEGWHSVDGHDDAVQIPGVVVYRWEAPLFFANASAFRQQLRQLAREHQPSWIVLQCEAITDIDVTAADMLRQLDDELNAQGIHLAFAELRSRLQEQALRYGLMETLDHDHFYPTLDDGAGQGPRRGHRPPARGGRTMTSSEPDTAIAPRRRAAALGALLAGTAAVVTAVVGLRGDLGRAVLAVIAVLMVVALVWTTTTPARNDAAGGRRRAPRRPRACSSSPFSPPRATGSW